MKIYQNEKTVTVKDVKSGGFQVKETANTNSSVNASTFTNIETKTYKRYDSLKGRTIKLDLCKQE